MILEPFICPSGDPRALFVRRDDTRALCVVGMIELVCVIRMILEPYVSQKRYWSFICPKDDTKPYMCPRDCIGALCVS